jgi:hypothetical protein
MSGVVFHNNTVLLNDTWYESHAHLVKMVALELGQTDKVPELLEKFLGIKMKIKPQKNPNAPKRAKSSYMFYSEKYREKIQLKVKKKNPNYKGSLMGLVSKDLGANWKKLKPNEKKPFEEQAQKDRDRYVGEMEEFNEKYA